MRLLSLFTIILIGLIYAGKSSAAIGNAELEADRFIYDQGQSIIEAKGNVVLVQNLQFLKADSITYNVIDDMAVAEGNVTLTDDNGDTHFADRIELSDEMRQGLIQNIYSELDDGSRFWANSAIRESETRHVLKDARYTPCKPCAINPEDDTPTWALRASEVVHDKQNATIKYDDVRFEAWGVPIAYAPFFSHPDGSVKQKSGFLNPVLGFGSDYGFNFMSPYYWAISPSADATIGLRVFSKSSPQLNLETRKRYENALVEARTSFTYSERTDRIDGQDILQDEEFRGHFELDTLWNINRHWRAGTEIDLASDEQYLEQYDISSDDILENRAYIEGFQGRSYASAELLAFQDLRLDQEVDQPNALPYLQTSLIASPDSYAGGRFQWDSSYLTLFREGRDQDVNRLSSSLQWQRQDMTRLGIVSKLDLRVRGDAYYTNDRDVARNNPAEDDAKFDSRFIPTAHYEVSLPLQKRVTKASLTIKPRLSITARPDIDNDSDIPNEDSQDAQINYTNLFDVDRFAGLDRVEDRTRVTYAMEGGYYSDNGDELTMAVGQSYRLEDEDNPFASGSGFEEQGSDLVGQIGASFDNHRHNLNYRFQIDGKKLNAERHEIYGGTKIDNTSMSAIYLYERGSQGTEFPDSREQISARVTQTIADNWTVTGAALYDLGSEPGLRQGIVGVGYDDDCFGITAELQRQLQREASGKDDLAILLRIRLKNLGEFETTAYDAGSGNDLDDDLSEEIGL